MKVKLRLDLETRAGRAAMRAYLDELDRAELARATPVAPPAPVFESPLFFTSPPAAPAPSPTFVGWSVPVWPGAADFLSPHPAQPEEGIPSQEQLPPAEAEPGVAEGRGSGQNGGEAPPQDSLPANPEPQPEGPPSSVASSDPAEPPEEAAAVPVAEVPDDADRDDEALDPKRDMTDADKVRIWGLAEAGYNGAAIARKLSFDHQRIHNLLWRIRNGKHRVPVAADAEPESEASETPSTALVVAAPPRAVVLRADGERVPCVDPVVAERRAKDMAERQVEGFVRRELYGAGAAP